MSRPRFSKCRSDRVTGLAAWDTEQALSRSRLYSQELGVDLSKRNDREFFKSFLAGLLLGARISKIIAKSAFRAFVRHYLLSARSILRVGRRYLVRHVMRQDDYVRYDESKSTQIVRDCTSVIADYGGHPPRLHDLATGTADLERRLLDFYGVGPVTANVFLREMRPYWSKADPTPLPIVSSRKRGASPSTHTIKSQIFCRIEGGLIRSRRRRAERAQFATKRRATIRAGLRSARLSLAPAKHR